MGGAQAGPVRLLSVCHGHAAATGLGTRSGLVPRESSRAGWGMSKDLRFRRLHLRNWKNFLRVEVAVRDRLFLVGANAAGKSNFLDAFRFLRDIALSGSGFREAVLDPRRGGVSGIRCLAARRYPDVEIAVELEEEGEETSWEYEIAFHQDNQRRPRIRRERVSRAGQVLVERPNKEDAADPERPHADLPGAGQRQSGLPGPGRVLRLDPIPPSRPAARARA